MFVEIVAAIVDTVSTLTINDVMIACVNSLPDEVRMTPEVYAELEQFADDANLTFWEDGSVSQ